eukprot:15473504-Alexandrium_andersonii.AAC.1
MSQDPGQLSVSVPRQQALHPPGLWCSPTAWYASSRVPGPRVHVPGPRAVRPQRPRRHRGT